METHNAFVHTNGTTHYETFTIILPSVLVTYISTCLTIVLGLQSQFNAFLFEFLLIIIPIVCNLTILAQHVSVLIPNLFIACIAITWLYKDAFKPSGKRVTFVQHKNFITNARSTINLLTSIAILAVDFEIFPRRFAKTESYGYSLMDVGVGLFVYSNGIVAQSKERVFLPFKEFKSVIPLLVLGLGRFVVTREINYNVPVSEYGVHWNFFITLAVTKIVCSILLNTKAKKYLLVKAVVLLVIHEIFLQSGLAKYVLGSSKRSNIISANREGIASCLGYICIYLFSVKLGTLMRNTEYVNRKWILFIKLFALSLVILLFTLLLEKYFGISRRLANSAYCCWTLFIGLFMTNLYYLCELLQQSVFKNVLSVPLIFEAVNSNGLVFFLVSNVLTGAVNILFNTRQMGSLSSLLIIVLYMFVNCGVSCVLYAKNIRLKL